MLAEGRRLSHTGVETVEGRVESEVGVGGGHEAGQTPEAGTGAEGGLSARLGLPLSRRPPDAPPTPAQRHLEGGGGTNTAIINRGRYTP